MSLRFGPGWLAIYLSICSCTFICFAPQLRARDYTTKCLLGMANFPSGVCSASAVSSCVRCVILTDERFLHFQPRQEPFRLRQQWAVELGMLDGRNSVVWGGCGSIHGGVGWRFGRFIRL